MTKKAEQKKQLDEYILQSFTLMAKTVSETLSPIAETVVNDLRPKKQKVSAIFNGHITGRKVGDPISSIGKKRLEGTISDTLINYESLGAKGQKIKSSAMAIRNPIGELIGSFGINLDLSPLETLSTFVNQFAQTDNQEVRHEKFTPTTPKTEIKKRVEQIATENGWAIHTLTKNQKIKIVKTLLNEGQFYKRGSVSIVAQTLRITRPSIYRYINILTEEK